MPSSPAASNSVFRNLPSVDEMLRTSIGRQVLAATGENYAVVIIRGVIADLRREIGQDTACEHSKMHLRKLAETGLHDVWRSEQSTGIYHVINATGVVIHTNLGRAPLSENARRAIAGAFGYCTLEYDRETGKRGKRGLRAESLLAELTGAEGVLIVNNCAAAAFFVLTVFASGGEVVISRGEMVEIGGDFRVPDVLAQSGATLREVGTTNRTKPDDYKNAIGKNTRVILRVHPSNYRIVGFTATPSLSELAVLAHDSGVMLYEDIGSGAIIDLENVGLPDEPLVSRSIEAGVDVVTFSGDKLLGGPQAGIIAGKTVFIERLRKHPLYRALRVDKIVYAALESTLESYRRDSALAEIPVLRMLSTKKAEIEKRAAMLVKALREKPGVETSEFRFELVDGFSAVGGGAAPTASLETKLIAISHKDLSASQIEKALRLSNTPVITRITNDRVIIDLRTVAENEDADLVAIISHLFGQNSS